MAKKRRQASSDEFSEQSSTTKRKKTAAKKPMSPPRDLTAMGSHTLVPAPVAPSRARAPGGIIRETSQDSIEPDAPQSPKAILTERDNSLPVVNKSKAKILILRRSSLTQDQELRYQYLNKFVKPQIQRLAAQYGFQPSEVAGKPIKRLLLELVLPYEEVQGRFKVQITTIYDAEAAKYDNLRLGRPDGPAKELNANVATERTDVDTNEEDPEQGRRRSLRQQNKPAEEEGLPMRGTSVSKPTRRHLLGSSPRDAVGKFYLPAQNPELPEEHVSVSRHYDFDYWLQFNEVTLRHQCHERELPSKGEKFEVIGRILDYTFPSKEPWRIQQHPKQADPQDYRPGSSRFTWRKAPELSLSAPENFGSNDELVIPLELDRLEKMQWCTGRWMKDIRRYKLESRFQAAETEEQHHDRLDCRMRAYGMEGWSANINEELSRRGLVQFEDSTDGLNLAFEALVEYEFTGIRRIIPDWVNEWLSRKAHVEDGSIPDEGNDTFDEGDILVEKANSHNEIVDTIDTADKAIHLVRQEREILEKIQEDVHSHVARESAPSPDSLKLDKVMEVDGEGEDNGDEQLEQDFLQALEEEDEREEGPNLEVAATVECESDHDSLFNEFQESAEKSSPLGSDIRPLPRPPTTPSDTQIPGLHRMLLPETSTTTHGVLNTSTLELLPQNDSNVPILDDAVEHDTLFVRDDRDPGVNQLDPAWSITSESAVESDYEDYVFHDGEMQYLLPQLAHDEKMLDDHSFYFVDLCEPMLPAGVFLPSWSHPHRVKTYLDHRKLRLKNPMADWWKRHDVTKCDECESWDELEVSRKYKSMLFGDDML